MCHPPLAMGRKILRREMFSQSRLYSNNTHLCTGTYKEIDTDKVTVSVCVEEEIRKQIMLNRSSGHISLKSYPQSQSTLTAKCVCKHKSVH